MKKIICILLCSLILTGAAACGGSSGNGEKTDKLSVVTTIFPEYDWVREITADVNGVDLTMLLDNGVDLHSYRPTADDIVKVSDCDMFIYVGGESDEWVDGVLAQAVNKDMVVLNLLEALGDRVKTEEVKEGMEEHGHDEDHGEEEGGEHDHDEDHGEEEGGEHDHEHEEELDEHVWLSLKNAVFLCETIAAKLAALDPANAEAYTANAEAYTAKLNALDARYAAAVEAASTKTLLFGDRFPFRYLVDDYGLDYYAAFAGCSAESEASFETIMFLANKADELGLKAIMQIESADGSIARTVNDATKTKDRKILTMDSLQSTTAAEVEAGATYLSAMEKNLEVLTEALK